MVNNSEQPNIKLTDDEIQLWEDWKAKIASLQENFITAQNNYVNINATIIAANKEKEYLNTQIETLITDTDTLTKKKDILSQDIGDKVSQIEEMNQKMEQISINITEKLDICASIQKDIAIRMEKLVSQETQCAQNTLILNEKLADVDKAKQVLQNAINALPWK